MSEKEMEEAGELGNGGPSSKKTRLPSLPEDAASFLVLAVHEDYASISISGNEPDQNAKRNAAWQKVPFRVPRKPRRRLSQA